MSSRRDDNSLQESIDRGMIFIGLCYIVAEWRSVLLLIGIVFGLLLLVVLALGVGHLGKELGPLLLDAIVGLVPYIIGGIAFVVGLMVIAHMLLRNHAIKHHRNPRDVSLWGNSRLSRSIAEVVGNAILIVALVVIAAFVLPGGPKFLFLVGLPLAGVTIIIINAAPHIRDKWHTALDSKVGTKVLLLWQRVPSDLVHLIQLCAIFICTLAAIVGVVSMLMFLHSCVGS